MRWGGDSKIRENNEKWRIDMLEDDSNVVVEGESSEKLLKAQANSVRYKHLYGENEWRIHGRGVKNAIEFDAMEEADKDVFKAIDAGIAEEEKRKSSYYVYLGVNLYKRMKEGAQNGLKGGKLCAYCDIMPSKFRKLKEKYVKLGDRLEALSERLVSQALLNIAENVIKNKDVNDSKWILERLDRENFGKSTSTVNMEVNHKHTIDMNKIKEIRGELMAIRDGSTDLETEGYHDTSAVVDEQEKVREKRDNGEVIDV